jgi:hypothetical protein
VEDEQQELLQLDPRAPNLPKDTTQPAWSISFYA